MPTIRHFYTSPGHNYVGHHGKAPSEHPIEEATSLELVAGKGIVGDRYFDWKENYKGQITFFDQAVVQAVRDQFSLPDLPSSIFRRNVIIEGVDLNALIGKTFQLAGVELEGVEECRPCYWMDQATGEQSVEDFLKGRGGLRCRILNDAMLAKGECELEVYPPPSN
ncbi:MAG: molybdenum cofactor biosysynthesis protein [Verrucomicrobiales bacterium]|nr:molybdenum cofactor biosysynthesis protein [Verrucomicrobiales bacterium]